VAVNENGSLTGTSVPKEDATRGGRARIVGQMTREREAKDCETGGLGGVDMYVLACKE